MQDQDVFGLYEIASQQGPTADPTRSRFFSEVFNLKWNPFPEIGVPESEVSQVAPIRYQVTQDIGKWIREAYTEKSRRVLVIRGEYGSGKSSLLRKIVSVVNQWSTGRGENRPKAIYVYRPSVEAHALNRAILEEIGIDDVRKMVWNVIRREMIFDLTEEVRSEQLGTLIKELLSPSRPNRSVGQTSLFGQPIITDIPQPLSQLFDPSQNMDYRVFLAEVDRLRIKRRDFHSYFTYLIARGLESPSSIANGAFVDLLLAYDEIEAWQALVNTKAPTRDRTDFVRLFLQNLIRLLKFDGYTYLFVAIDEFEQVTEPTLMSPKDRADYSYTMMEIINRIDQGLGLIISITGPGFDKLEQVNAALVDRLDVVPLEPLRTTDVERLVRFYLDELQARANEDDPGRTGLFTFSPGRLEASQPMFLSMKYGSTPRVILKYFRKLLDYCADREITTIDRDVATKFGRSFREGRG